MVKAKETRMAKKYLITGGAGFIGSNYADHLLGRGAKVTIIDNLSRRGADMSFTLVAPSPVAIAHDPVLTR